MFIHGPDFQYYCGKTVLTAPVGIHWSAEVDMMTFWKDFRPSPVIQIRAQCNVTSYRLKSAFILTSNPALRKMTQEKTSRRIRNSL
jgi:hypothetical protein